MVRHATQLAAAGNASLRSWRRGDQQSVTDVAQSVPYGGALEDGGASPAAPAIGATGDYSAMLSDSHGS